MRNIAKATKMPGFLATGAVMVLMLVAGCASQDAIQTERLLAASGFRMQLADTPNRMEHLKTLPQRKLTPHKHADGQIGYIYADAEFCKCLYSGSQKSYDQFEKLSTEQEIAMERRASETMLESEELRSDLWGTPGWN